MGMNSKLRVVCIVAGVLWLLLGLRDLLAPGFFSPNGRIVSTWMIVSSFALGIFFLLLPFAFVKKKDASGVPPA